MKKNISINLQGIIFHIEEDGYDQLSTYLASIRNYFSTYEGHEEIIADIEARIAEIFAKHLSPGKQVITLEDVQKLIAQMGNVTDFEQEEPVLEEQEYRATASTGFGEAADPGNGPNYGTGYGPGSGTGYGPGTSSAYGTGTGPAPGYQEAASAAGPKKLYRDVSQKIISGVSAGIANYLGVDPLWVRLLFVFLLVLAPFTAGLSIAFVLAGYIILWNSLPANYNLHPSKVKKLFRDPLDKKLGGVASGLAKFFGLDVTVVRILFLASFLVGGVGFLLYIILWIAVPEAVTLTEKMQMQGNPVTLSGIEESLKENLRFKDQNGEETETAKLLMLPLRLLAHVLTWIGRALGNIFSALIAIVRVLAGIFLLAVSAGMMFSLFIMLLVALGVLDSNTAFVVSDIPFEVYLNGVPEWGLLAGFVAGFILSLLLFVLGISLLAKRLFLSPIAGWSMFGVWLASVFALATALALYNQNFRHTSETETNRSFPVEAYQTITFDAFDAKRSYGSVRIEVQSHSSPNVEVRQRAEARGRTEDQARENARMISYSMVQRDSVLRFDDSFAYNEGAAFRKQKLQLTLLVPEKKQLRFTPGFIRLMPTNSFEGNYSRAIILRNLWQVEGDKFVCITCAADTLDNTAITSDFEYERASEPLAMPGSVLLQKDDYGRNGAKYNYAGFTRISANGPYHLQIRQGDSFSVSVRGSENDISKLRISKEGNELAIEPRNNINKLLFNQKKLVLIQITMPDLQALDLAGAIKADVNGFKGDNFDMVLTGAIKSMVNVEAATMKLDISGVSESTLTGRADKLVLDMAGAGKVDATNLEVKQVRADVTGACKADVYATQVLRADAAGASKIRYKGEPADVATDVTGASKIIRL